MTPPRLLACWLAGCILLPALESVPMGVFGIPSPEPEEEGTDRSFGGAAVLIDTAGHALTLAEALPPRTVEEDAVTVVLPGGERRSARIVARGDDSTAVLLRVPLADVSIAPLPLADSDAVAVGDTVWSVGNPFRALETDARPAVSRGIVSGRYAIPPHSPVVRGRKGKVLSRYRGPVLETTAAINDGNQGGALVDDAGALVGLASLGVSHQRRLGTAVPLATVLADLDLEPARRRPAGATDPVAAALVRHATKIARSTVLVYFQRPQGLGNPRGIPRPQPITPRTPAYRRRQLQRQWDRYYHQQQIFFTDQAVCAVVIDAAAGLLLTASHNLHGGARAGTILAGREDAPPGEPVPVWVKASDPQLGLALLKAVAPLDLPDAPLAEGPDLATGDPLAVVGRHRDGGPFTVTTGVVSTPVRELPVAEDESRRFGQTDALANYGNLGGPVVDLSGAVVGISVLLAPRPYPWGTNSGVAMFLGAAAIRSALPAMREGRLGTGFQLAANMTIDYILPRSAAAAVGLRYGDRLLACDGTDLHSPDELQALVDSHEAGDSVVLRILRDGHEIEITINLRKY